MCYVYVTWTCSSLMFMLGGRAMLMTQGCLKKRSVIESMDSHGLQQVPSITVTLKMLFSIASNIFMNNLSAYWLVVCVCVCVWLYYLVDLGLPIGTSFLPSHKSTRYHAQKFHSSNRQSTSKKELYNYRHLSLQMVIEWSFGVLKVCFPILNLMPNFKQSR